MIKIEFLGYRIVLCLCHRKPERSFKINGWQMPLCSRCTGLMVGLLISLLLRPLLSSTNHFWSAGLTLPLIIDGFTQSLGYRESNNILRFVTGVLFTIGAATVIWGL